MLFAYWSCLQVTHYQWGSVAFDHIATQHENQNTLHLYQKQSMLNLLSCELAILLCTPCLQWKYWVQGQGWPIKCLTLIVIAKHGTKGNCVLLIWHLPFLNCLFSGVIAMHRLSLMISDNRLCPTHHVDVPTSSKCLLSDTRHEEPWQYRGKSKAYQPSIVSWPRICSHVRFFCKFRFIFRHVW